MTINRVCISLLIIVATMTACNSQQSKNDMSKIDLETIDFDTLIDSLLKEGKFFYLAQSPIDNSLHYSFILDSFRYNHIIFEGKNNDPFYHGKPESLDDVFTIDGVVNRIDIYPSSNASIDAIVLIINNKDKAEQFLRLLDMPSDENLKTWTDPSLGKSYLMKKESWMIDNTKMLTLTYCIVKSDADSLIQKLEAYYR